MWQLFPSASVSKAKHLQKLIAYRFGHRQEHKYLLRPVIDLPFNLKQPIYKPYMCTVESKGPWQETVNYTCLSNNNNHLKRQKNFPMEQ